MTTQEQCIKYDFVAPLKSSKCVRPNSMSTKILHLIVDKISIPLSEIIIKSFSTCSFRNICKTAKAIPIFKTESKLLCSNYRPISLLSNISKIIGKIMHQRLNKFLEESNCSYNLQFGFRLITLFFLLLKISNLIQTMGTLLHVSFLTLKRLLTQSIMSFYSKNLNNMV